MNEIERALVEERLTLVDERIVRNSGKIMEYERRLKVLRDKQDRDRIESDKLWQALNPKP